MTDNASDTPRYQISIASVLLILTCVAVLLTLVKYSNTQLTESLFELAIELGLPLAWCIDYGYRRREERESLSDAMLLRRCVAILACCIVLIIAYYLAILACEWSGKPAKTPPSLLIALAQVSVGLLLSPFTHFSEVAGRVYLAVPAFLLVYLCFPILRNRENANLPVRSTAILTIYSATDIYWFKAKIFADLAASRLGVDVSSMIINSALLLLLWGARLCWRGSFNTSKVVVWNLTLIIWLFYFSHPWIR